MNIGLWNIDHPETGTRSKAKTRRFKHIKEYLVTADMDLYIITEANAALQLNGYWSMFSAESPFISKARIYTAPNVYHQVGIYSKCTIQKMETIEPVNSLHCTIDGHPLVKELYGNVITIKDRWNPASTKTYSDRLEEQVRSITHLPTTGALVAGDFNLRLGWTQKKSAYQRLDKVVEQTSLSWPTKLEQTTVQHILHTPDMNVQYELDHRVTYDHPDGLALSDHPFVHIEVTTSS